MGILVSLSVTNVRLLLFAHKVILHVREVWERIVAGRSFDTRSYIARREVR